MKKVHSFSHKIFDPRLAKQRIMLPATENGEPDYEYMEQYVKNIMIKKYQSYLEYVEKQKKKMDLKSISSIFFFYGFLLNFF